MDDKIWYNDLKGFIKEDKFYNFFPRSNMTYYEKINSIIRFTLYLVIILLLFKNNYKVLYILIIVLLLTYAMSLVDRVENTEKKEEFIKQNVAVSKATKKECFKPTDENPYMNVLLTDYKVGSIRNKREACDVENKHVKKMMGEKYDDKLFRSIGDIYTNNSSDRQFYTMPNTDIINDQTGFAKWLYDNGSTCKQGAVEKCYDNVNEVSLHTIGGNGGVS